jgi:hypothetical protein
MRLSGGSFPWKKLHPNRPLERRRLRPGPIQHACCCAVRVDQQPHRHAAIEGGGEGGGLFVGHVQIVLALPETMGYSSSHRNTPPGASNMFKITVTAKGSTEVLAQFSANTQAACFAWAKERWSGDQFNWSVNFTGYEAGIGGAL